LVLKKEPAEQAEAKERLLELQKQFNKNTYRSKSKSVKMIFILN